MVVQLAIRFKVKHSLEIFVELAIVAVIKVQIEVGFEAKD